MTSQEVFVTQIPTNLADTTFLCHSAKNQNFSYNNYFYISSFSFSETTQGFLSSWNQSETNKSLPSFHSNRESTWKYLECSNSCITLIFYLINSYLFIQYVCDLNILCKFEVIKRENNLVHELASPKISLVCNFRPNPVFFTAIQS